MRGHFSLTCLLLSAALAAIVPVRAKAQNPSPITDVLTAADQAWDARQFDLALERYQAALAQDSTSLRALFRTATMLGWRRDFERSATLFRSYLRLAPTDDDARVGLARTLAWGGDYDQAIAICDSVVVRDPRRGDALQLGAQARAWSVARSPSLEPTVSTMEDSDQNRTMTYLVRGGLPSLGRAQVFGDATYRVADFRGERGTSAAVHAAATWAASDAQWTFRTDAGAASVRASGPFALAATSRVLPLLAVRITERPASALTIGASISRVPFDETAPLMFAGIATTRLGADGDLALASPLHLTADGGWTRLTGGSGPNGQVAGAGSLRWSATTYASIAASVRGFSYDHAAFDGYFAPRGYVLGEMSGRIHVGGELGWAFESELGIGDQTITWFDDSRAARFAQRASVAVAYRPLPGFEWVLSGSFANVASPTTISSADYRAYTAAIKGRFRL